MLEDEVARLLILNPLPVLVAGTGPEMDVLVGTAGKAVPDRLIVRPGPANVEVVTGLEGRLVPCPLIRAKRLGAAFTFFSIGVSFVIVVVSSSRVRLLFVFVASELADIRDRSEGGRGGSAGGSLGVAADRIDIPEEEGAGLCLALAKIVRPGAVAGEGALFEAAGALSAGGFVTAGLEVTTGFSLARERILRPGVGAAAATGSGKAAGAVMTGVGSEIDCMGRTVLASAGFETFVAVVGARGAVGKGAETLTSDKGGVGCRCLTGSTRGDPSFLAGSLVVDNTWTGGRLVTFVGDRLRLLVLTFIVQLGFTS
jgi:hypothetical protein